MRWMTISAISSAVGYAGWWFGSTFFSATSGLWLSFLASLGGLWAGMILFPRN